MTSRRSAPETRRPSSSLGLVSLRKPGHLTELLFLHEIATRPYGGLKPIAERIGVSVQASSYLYRRLAREGKVVVAGGRYQPTALGIETLHSTLSSIWSDLGDRMAQLRLIQRCRAVASVPLAAQTPVELYMRDGLMHARPGSAGPSRGIVASDARAGELVEVEQLEGILPLTPGPVRCIVLDVRRASEPSMPSRMREILRTVPPHAVLAAEGLEAVHLLSRATRRPSVRYGVAAAAREASLVGVPVVVLVTDERLPLLLEHLSEPGPSLPLEIQSLAGGARPASSRQ